jgi:hypothetical protein
LNTALRVIAGYEIFAMIRKGQVPAIPTNKMRAQRAMIASLFAIVA